MVPAASVGYRSTETKPAIQSAKSALNQCVRFFEMIAMRLPGAKPRDCRFAAMRRASSITCAQRSSRSAPAQSSCLNTVRSGVARSRC